MLFWHCSMLSLFSHLPISLVCSDTDWRRTSMMLYSNILAAILGKAQSAIHRRIYLHLQCTPDNNFALIIFPQWLQWCVLSPKGQCILLIDLSHAVERERHGESSFNCGFRGLFPMWWCHCVSKRSLQGACTPSEGLSIILAHILLFSPNPLLTVFTSSLTFIFYDLVQTLIISPVYAHPLLSDFTHFIFPSLTTYIFCCLSISQSHYPFFIDFLSIFISRTVRCILTKIKGGID